MSLSQIYMDADDPMVSAVGLPECSASIDRQFGIVAPSVHWFDHRFDCTGGATANGIDFHDGLILRLRMVGFVNGLVKLGFWAQFFYVHQIYEI